MTEFKIKADPIEIKADEDYKSYCVRMLKLVRAQIIWRIRVLLGFKER